MDTKPRGVATTVQVCSGAVKYTVFCSVYRKVFVSVRKNIWFSFFSQDIIFRISGIVCKKIAMAMTDDLVIMRSLLKANIKLLDDSVED